MPGTRKRIDYIFYGPEHDEFRAYTACAGTRSRWTNQPLIYDAETAYQMIDSAETTVWIILNLQDPRPDEAKLVQRYGDQVEFRAQDGMLAVLRVEPRGSKLNSHLSQAHVGSADNHTARRTSFHAGLPSLGEHSRSRRGRTYFRCRVVTEQTLIFFAMVFAFLVLATIFIRRFDSLMIVVLIVTTPFSIFRFMPREIFGITGLSAFNVVWLVATWVIIFMILAVRREGVRSARFFTVSVVVFFFAYTHSVIWAMVDIGSYPQEGRYVITRKDLLLEDLFKPLQLVLTGWVIYAYLRMGGSRRVIDLGVLLTAIAWGFVITGYFATGFVGGDIYAGRDAVTLMREACMQTVWRHLRFICSSMPC